MNNLDTPPSEVKPEEQPRTIRDFPQESKYAVDGLLWLGFIEESVSLWGHDFVLRTLRVGEDLLVSQLVKEFENSFGQEQALATATVALALKSIDGDPDFCSQASKSVESYARARFRYVQESWYMPVVVRLFNTYLELLAKQDDALRRVEDLSQGSLSTSILSPDSLPKREESEEPTVAEEQMAELADLADSNEDS